MRTCCYQHKHKDTDLVCNEQEEPTYTYAGEKGDGMAGMRHFGTGATRDQDTSKHDYEGFNCPLVEKSFGAYMTTHRIQPDGSVRASDNWQLGIPRDAYIKSLLRHVHDLWLHHRGYPEEAVDRDIESVLCAIRFNTNGYLHEVLKERRRASAS